MNKKILGSLMALVVIATIIFMNLDRRSEKEKLIDAVSWFIYEQNGEFDEYKAIELFEVTNEVLLADVQLKTQIEVVRDTLSQKVNLLNAYGQFPQAWLSEVEKFNALVPDQLDDLIKLNAKVDLALTAIEDSQRKEAIFLREQKAMELIEGKLNALNLSIFSIDLSGAHSIHYVHRFSIDGKEQLSVFELDTESKEVISFKLIG